VDKTKIDKNYWKRICNRLPVGEENGIWRHWKNYCVDNCHAFLSFSSRSIVYFCYHTIYECNLRDWFLQYKKLYGSSDDSLLNNC